jgi:Rieske Fe-S protein
MDMLPPTESPASDLSGEGCAGCSRRQFLASASVLSLSALAVACGDGVISEPAVRPEFPNSTFTLNPDTTPGLQQVGGRAVITSGSESPVLIERVGAKQYRALSLICPHKGTIVEVKSSGFTCPNHLARFDSDGTWVGGQQTTNLAPVGVVLNADGTITVGGSPVPPALALGATTAVFATLVSDTTIAAQTVAVSNSGGSILSGLQVSLAYASNQPSGWLSVSLDQASAPATLTLRATKGSLAAGTYNANVTLSAAGITNGPQTLAVSLIVRDPNAAAALQVSAATAAFTGAVNSAPAAQTLQLTNGGGGTIANLTATVAYGAGATGWLAATLSGPTAPATLTLRPTLTGLSAGTYTASVTLSAPGIASRTVVVTLSVTAAGLRVTLASWPALANVGGVAGSVGSVNGGPVAVARTGPSSFLAFSMRCPHAGTTVNVVNNSSFRCPNHGALFDGTGVWQPSPQRTSDLQRLTVSYTPGDTVLYIT